uniref:Putative transcription factor yin yang 2 n=1 Tax=Angiostrongylus cantonensis TaxID=6313 RepID=C7BVM0_ANGCA|nr:putative transcription factor yin yang 2 [Angiostrongylus cantonensis]
MRKINVDDCNAPGSWFPKKVVITTDSRRFETTAWAHCSGNLISALSSNETPCPMENSPGTSLTVTASSDTASLDDLDCTRCGSTQDPSLSSINASSWYPSHTSALPPIPSPNPNTNFGLSSITSGTNIDTGSLINADSPLDNEDSEEPKKHTRNHKRFGIEVQRFNIPLNVYPRNARQPSSSSNSTTTSTGYPCFVEGCKSILRNRTALRKHAKVHAERRHSCEQCGRRFAEKTKLNRHMLIHTGERAFRCEVDGCSRAFSLEANLKSHLKTHTGEKPHKCQFCERAFSHPYNLRVHISRRHKDKKLG